MKKIAVLLILVVIALWLGSFFWKNLKSEAPKNTNLKSPTKNSFATQERVSVIAEGLDVPWSIAILPDKSMLATERRGTLRFIDKNGSLASSPVATIDDVKQVGEGGLLGIIIHPNFQNNHYVYIYYTYSSNGVNTLNRVVRFTFDGTSIGDEKIIIEKIPGGLFHDGGRIKFGPDGFLYITTGDATTSSLAQNKNSLAGKILRLTDEGKIPSDNPFGTAIYSFGHRNPQGITWDSDGNLWETEHGPSGIWPNCCQDEINLIEKARNYGWPDSVGDKLQPGTKAPTLHSARDIWAPGSAAYLNGSIFFGGLRGVALYEYRISDKKLITHLKDEFGRIREVVVGPDGFLYLTTSNKDGRGTPAKMDDRIIRINPQKL